MYYTILHYTILASVYIILCVMLLRCYAMLIAMCAYAVSRVSSSGSSSSICIIIIIISSSIITTTN